MTKKRTSRRFLGVFPPQNNYDKKHLRAYIKGYTRFQYGIDAQGYPIYHNVLQEYYEVEETKKENNENMVH